jgi:CBS domain-containing protein
LRSGRGDATQAATDAGSPRDSNGIDDATRGDMRLRHWTSSSAPSVSFETLRQMVATVDHPRRRRKTMRQVFLASHLPCHKGGPEHGADACLECGRLVSVVPSPGAEHVTVRCLWTESDVVDDVMTPTRVLATVPPNATLGDADRVAAREKIHHLLVRSDDWIEGVVCRCALAAAGSPAGNRLAVADRMIADITTVPTGTTLGQAWRAIEATSVGLIAITRDGELLGVVTRRDLGLDEGTHAPGA